MQPVRKAFQAEVLATPNVTLQGSLYLLGVARERTVQFIDRTACKQTEEFADFLLERDMFYVKWLTGEDTSARNIEESLVILQKAVSQHVRINGVGCMHWLTQVDSNIHQIIYEILEEESCQRGELMLSLNVAEENHYL